MLKRGITLLVCILVVYAALVATHQGEFWPFSIYPMFSGGGKPWTHALVRKMSVDPEDISWNNIINDNLPGKAFALDSIRINQSDLSAYLENNKPWHGSKIKGLRAYFKPKLDQNSFVLFEVHGQIANSGQNSVAVTYIPLILIREDTTIFNPQIFNSLVEQAEP
jgi:hypothetical protein